MARINVPTSFLCEQWNCRNDPEGYDNCESTFHFSHAFSVLQVTLWMSSDRRAKSRRFDEFLHRPLPWDIVPASQLHLRFQREETPPEGLFVFVINQEYGSGVPFVGQPTTGS
jgi:hypothetical protein